MRVGERVREELSILLSRDAKDPRLSRAIVSRVLMTDDVRFARVWVRTLTDSNQAERDELVEALKRATPMLRREVGQRVGLRFAPELRFLYDDGQDNVSRIEELLHEIQDEDRKRGS
jgi:ribosome-binding factor A